MICCLLLDSTAAVGPWGWEQVPVVAKARLAAGEPMVPTERWALCLCHSPWHWCLHARPLLARAGTVSLGQATALASGCKVSAHLGHSSVVSLIKAAGANYCHMLGMI